MSSQLLEDTLDHAHADELMTRLSLPEHFDGDRFDRVSRRTNLRSTVNEDRVETQR